MNQDFTEEYIEMLARKWKEGTITDEEQKVFDEWYNQYRDELLELPQGYAGNALEIRDRIHSRIKTGIKQNTRKQLTLFSMWRAASVAAIVVLVAGLSYYYSSSNKGPIVKPIALSSISPGSDKAILTLSDGSTIQLTGAQKGVVAHDASARISIGTEGEIVYAAADENSNEDLSANTIQTPKGGQYRIVLPDGTKVRLNAASSLQYPTRFSGKLRAVTLSGEAFFEVAHNKAMPFVVRTATQNVQVLGTHFNVNSYIDEGRTVTTLEEGSVQVQSGASIKPLRPGQQSIVSGKGAINVQQADMETALAWKNNEMVFKDASVKEVMRQIARWYNLDIVYEGAIPDDTITASIDRQSNLSTVLKIFSTIQIHFTLTETPQGKQLIIKP